MSRLRMRVSNRLAGLTAFQRVDVNRPRDGNGWYKITNSIGQADIYMYDEIGFWGVSAASFVQELQALEAVHIDLHINSPGGDAWDGIAIYNALCNHPASVTTHVDGLAASAASFIAQAGGKVIIARNGTMMIHDAEGLCIGNCQEMIDMAELLDRTSNNIADIYAQRCSTVGVWRKAMKAVSWYVGQEAIDSGLADELYDPEPGTDNQPAERRRRAANSAPLPVLNRTPRPVSTVCPTHNTATTEDGNWDANAEQGKLTFPLSVANVRKMYGWYDGSRVDNGDLPRDACKLPHHVVSDSGTPGDAHMGGVRAALGRLSQSDIPTDEQDAVRAHLNKHLEDGGGTPGDDIEDQTIVAKSDDFSEWWNPDIFKTAVATAANLHSLYGFSPDMFREAIRSVATDFPALESPRPVSRELPPAEPTITLQEFENAIKRGLL